VGLLTLVQYFFGLDLGIDQLLMEHYITVKTFHPGRMGPNTALSFSLTGAALLVMVWSTRSRQRLLIAGLLGSIVVALGAVAFTGYMSGIESAYGWAHLTRMAVHTAVGFMVLGFGVIASAWREGSAEETAPPRWLPLPVGIGVVTLAVCLWQAIAAREHVLDPEIESSIPEVTLVVGLLMAGLFALSVHLAQAARLRADELQAANQELENQITERERAERRFQQLVEFAPDALVLTNDRGEIVLVNVQTERLLGYERAELLGQSVDLLVPERLRSGHLEKHLAYCAEPAPRLMGSGIERWALRKDGSEVPVEIALGPLETEQGLLVVTTLRDITERKQREELDRFFTLSLDLLCIAGLDGYFKRLNPSWEKLLGYAEEELLARPYLDFVHPDDREATVAEAARLAAGGEVISFENRYRAKDGSYRWLLWRSASDPGRKLVYAAARDITERKQAEDALQRTNIQLEAINKELEAFTYSVSHDLRAPLRHIDGFARILREDFGPGLEPEAHQYLERICQGSRQMGALIDDLLNLARVGRQEVRLQVTGLNSLVEEVRADLQRETADRPIDWQIDSLPFVECDPALMKQVFANLLANAVKFTRPRPRARIEVGQMEQNGQPVVFVRDNGVGFSMKYAHKLFGVFQRLHRQEDFEGTGVGLATVQRIIHKHGGRVWAEAELDKGAAFYFTLGAPEPAEAGGVRPEPVVTPTRIGHEGERE
jgi:PAS domain S-box-containing protein